MENLTLCFTFTDQNLTFSQHSVENYFRENDLGFRSMKLKDNKLIVTFDNEENYQIGEILDDILGYPLKCQPCEEEEEDVKPLPIEYTFTKKPQKLTNNAIKKEFSQKNIGLCKTDFKLLQSKLKFTVIFKTQEDFIKGCSIAKLLDTPVKMKILDKIPEKSPGQKKISSTICFTVSSPFAHYKNLISKPENFYQKVGLEIVEKLCNKKMI